MHFGIFFSRLTVGDILCFTVTNTLCYIKFSLRNMPVDGGAATTTPIVYSGDLRVTETEQNKMDDMVVHFEVVLTF